MNAVLKRLVGYSAVCAMLCGPLPALSGDGEDLREGGLTGTGIVGEIASLGSIWVNDQRITFSADLPVASPLRNLTAPELQPGDVVAVAVRRAADVWVADEITQNYPAIGPVSAVQDAGLTVLGVAVDVPDGAPRVQPGDWVAVSGFWASDRITATRVEKITPRPAASLQGSYAISDDGTTTTVGSVPLGVDPLQHAQDGDVIRVEGQWRDAAFEVTDIHRGLFTNPKAVVLAEGYLSDVAPSGHYTVSGSGLSSFTENPATVMPQERVTVCGVRGRLLHSADAVSDNELAALRALGCDSRPDTQD